MHLLKSINFGSTASPFFHKMMSGGSGGKPKQTVRVILRKRVKQKKKCSTCKKKMMSTKMKSKKMMKTSKKSKSKKKMKKCTSCKCKKTCKKSKKKKCVGTLCFPYDPGKIICKSEFFYYLIHVQ